MIIWRSVLRLSANSKLSSCDFQEEVLRPNYWAAIRCFNFLEPVEDDLNLQGGRYAGRRLPGRDNTDELFTVRGDVPIPLPYPTGQSPSAARRRDP